MNLPGFTAELSLGKGNVCFAALHEHGDGAEAVIPASWRRRIYCAAVCAACGNRDAGEWCWRCSRCQMTGDA